MKIRNYQIALFALSTGCAWSQTPAEAIAPFVGQQLILPGGGDEAKVKLKKLQLSRMTAGRMRSSPTPLFHRKVASTSCSNNQKGGFTQVPAGFGADTYQAILADLNGVCSGRLPAVRRMRIAITTSCWWFRMTLRATC
jgi:hypothetical protein